MAGEKASTPERRTRMRGDERREMILRSAKHVFAQHSYAEASTGELARESDVTEPMLYKHFGSKKGLFLAVLREFSDRFMLLWHRRVNQQREESLLTAVMQVVMEYRAAITEDPDIHKALFQAVAESGDPEIAACVRKHNQKVYAFIHQLLQQAQAAGVIRADVNVDVAAWGYMSMILATQYSLMLNLTDELTNVRIMEMSRLWLRALC